MNYRTCQEKRITIHAWDAHMWDRQADGSPISVHSVHNAIKIFNLTFFFGRDVSGGGRVQSGSGITDAKE
jgi:hypothetical protein